ncbi:Uncharacterized conserved protein [Bosea sp. CRIB-10]|uniref:SphA family protein n=1 Tax=Bosea sp. CRIB-10 TaxID=378404 RepID=UPI0008EDE13B|nr:transporter [Bosea sp. CRIB-10]SFD66973.1 Uncharacterized conserved protein [Bosea sp. CRIB-10]
MRLLLAQALSVIVALTALNRAAVATEGGASLYVPGLRGPLAGVVPPPGFYFENDFYSYSGRLSAAKAIPIGGAVVSNVKVEARVNFMTPTWVTPIEILGGNLAFAVTVPFGTPRVSAGAVITGPRGRSIGFSQRDATFNIGDPAISSFIGWHQGNFHWQTGVTVNIPSGSYQDGELSNLSFNRWIGDIYAAVTYLNPATGIDLSGAVGFEINGKNDATDYRSGNAIHADIALSKNFTKQFSAGLLASHYQQVSGDGGRGATLGPYKGRVTALAAQIAYTFEVAGTPVSARLKVLREVDVDNRSRGTIGLFSIGFPIGHSAAAPKAAPARPSAPR